MLILPAELRKIPWPAEVVLAETFAALTLRGDPTLLPIVPAVEVRFKVGVVILALLVMLLFEVIETEVVPLTALVRVTPPEVAVRATVLPVMVPPELVMLVAAVMLKAPPEAAVPAWEFPEMLILPAVFKKMP